MSQETQRQQELDAIAERYTKRRKKSWKQAYYENAQNERFPMFAKVVRERFAAPQEIKFLEIGAGHGENLQLFHQQGIPWSHMYANELLGERVEAIRRHFPDELKLLPGNGLDIREHDFDLIFVSTVFSSILDAAFRQDLARHMLDLLRPGGLVLWYDFVYRNPFNADVLGITARELRRLFADSPNIQVTPITLSPYLGILVGPLYRWFSAGFSPLAPAGDN